ncbi:MAG TPA: RNB domain-containing ribonuclease [Myxococcota bacterium]|nr:RNB domain-containing ribonuclease [Myxococcota bacterium]
MREHAGPPQGQHSGKPDLRGIARRAMTDRALLPDFSGAALIQVARLTEADASAAAGERGLRDLRDRLWLSIDNDDSLDLDQLSVAEPLAKGAVKLYVAIADVDALVAKSSAVDDHARANTTSVYTAAQIFPMLPEKLSTDLTSLRQDVDRAALVVELTVEADGAIADSSVYRASVRNRAKLAYNGVAAWLEGTAPAPAPVTALKGVDEQLRVQDKLAQLLRARRLDQGALTLETVEARAVFDDGTLTDLVPERRNRAKDLIEDLMIAANGVTARFLQAKKLPSLRRVLRSPERWAKIVELAASVGEKLPAEPSNAALEAFLKKRCVADPARFVDLSVSVVKLLGRGEYDVELPGQKPTGHFALALRDYTHSTAPNRRFPDLITQRLLKCALAGARSPYSNGELNALASHCTEQEDAATKVERTVRKSAAALLLSSHVGETFDALVTGASSKGTWVRIAHPAAEGMLVRGAEGADVGDKLRVKLVRTDFQRGFVDFARA